MNDLHPKAPDIITEIAFEPIKQSLKRDLVKWEEQAPLRSERARTAGLASGKARQLTSSKRTKTNSLVKNELNELGATKRTVSVSVSDIVIDRDLYKTICETILNQKEFWVYVFKITKVTEGIAKERFNDFIMKQEAIENYQPAIELKKYFINWLEKNKEQQPNKPTSTFKGNFLDGSK